MSGLECFSLEQGRRPTACAAGDTRTTIMTIALRLPTLALAAALAAGVAVSWQAIGQTTLKINIAVAQNSHYGVAIDTFAREVERRTNGRYKVQTFFSAALGAERESTAADPLGTPDLTLPSTGPLPNCVPEIAILDIPFTDRDLAHSPSVR